MAFLVYLFVLLVAAGSVIFGLDLTQSPLQPPTYATASATNDAPPQSAPAPVQTAKATTSASVKAPSPVKTAAPVTAKESSEPVAVASARAQATSEEAQMPQTPAPMTTAAVTAPNHCAVDACAAAYHSFRASDCTYQPYGTERRVCTKGAPTKRIAVARPAAVHRAARPVEARRAYDRSYAERDSYAEPRRDRGWAFDLFGDAFGR